MDLTCTPPACVHHSSSTSSRSRAACEIASGSNSSALGIGRSLISKTIAHSSASIISAPKSPLSGRCWSQGASALPDSYGRRQPHPCSIATPQARKLTGAVVIWILLVRSWSRKSRLPDNVSIFDEVVVHTYEVRVKQRPVSPVAKAVRVLASCHSCSGPSHNASSTILSCPAFSRAHLG